MRKYAYNPKSAGVTLVEAVVAVAIITLSVLGLVSVFQKISHEAFRNTERIQSQMLLTEGMDAIRLMRNESWSANIAPLAENTRYWLSFATSTGQWNATTSPIFVNGKYERRFKIQPVRRDSSTDDIIESGGYIDGGTKKVEMRVLWATSSSATSSRRIDFYITDLFSN